MRLVSVDCSAGGGYYIVGTVRARVSLSWQPMMGVTPVSGPSRALDTVLLARNRP